MGRLIFATGLGGWAIIVAIWYKLEASRIAAMCYGHGDCLSFNQRTLDNIIVIGLIVGLLFILVSMILYARTVRPVSVAKPSGWAKASLAQQALPR